MRTLRILCTLACALLCVALVTASAQAAPKRHPHRSRHAAGASARTAHGARVATHKAGSAPGSAGMVIAVDPESGALRMPTAEERQALGLAAQDDLNQSDVGLVPVRHANGMVSVDLQGRFQDYTVVRVGSDGRMIFGCGQTQAGAMAETNAPSRASGALEVK